MLQFDCTCGKRLQTKEDHAGMQVACPTCGALLIVPGIPQAIRSTAAPPQPGPAPVGPSRYTSGRPYPDAEGEPRTMRRGPRPIVAMSGKAVASLILGLLTILFPVLLAIPAIILGILAIREINRSAGRLTGKGMAITGLIAGTLGNVSLVLFIMGYVGIRNQQARTHSNNNLKQLVLAMHMHHDVYKRLPAAASYDPQGRPLLSWRVAILPFVEQANLYQQFHLNEPWDSPHNLQLLSRMPAVFDSGRGDAPPDHTHYMVFTGPNTPYRGPTPPRLPATFLDGTSNTILIVEADATVPWTKPADLPVTPNAPLPRFGGVWGSGFYVAMADGSTRFLDHRRVSEQTLRLAIDPADGMPLPLDWDDDFR